VRVDPDDDLLSALLDLLHVLLPPVLVPIGTARWGATTSRAVPS